MTARYRGVEPSPSLCTPLFSVPLHPPPVPRPPRQISKSGLLDRVLMWAKYKESAALTKKGGSKKAVILGIPKLDDANYAGSSKVGGWAGLGGGGVGAGLGYVVWMVPRYEVPASRARAMCSRPSPTLASPPNHPKSTHLITIARPTSAPSS
jgi:hypothetical protein